MDTANPTLVTGASGFIGRRLLRPHDRSLIRTATGLPNGVVGDLSDPTTLAAACQGIGTILHCAGHAHALTSSDPDSHWRINYEGTLNLLRAAGDAGVQRFIFLSSVKAMAEPGSCCVDEDWLGEPASAYGKSKRAAEDAVLDAGARYGMHVVNLRLTMVYGFGCRGNLERMVRGISAGWFPPLPETGNRRSLVHVEDVVDAVRLVAAQPRASGRTYIVCDPCTYSGREIYDSLRVALGISPARYRIPQWILRTGGHLGDILGLISFSQSPLNSEVVDRLLGSACYLPSRIEDELGWRAKIDLRRGVSEMLGLPQRHLDDD